MSVYPVVSRVALLFLFLAAPASAGTALTLAEAERLALEHAPSLARAHTGVRAATERVVYETRLPDPQLTVGFLNVPTDTYKTNQEDMTMTMVGVRQAFPPGDTLQLRGRRAEKELTREQARLETERRSLLRQIRQTWLELHYLNAARQVVEQTRALLLKQLESAEGRYRAGAAAQPDVFKARQALGRLDEREQMRRAQQSRTQAALARWIGARAYDPLPDALPALPTAAAEFDPAHHPEAQAAGAMLDAARAEADMTRQEYKPGVMLDLQYGFRRPMADGTERPDMITAMVTFDLPVFRAKRQDRRLAEKQAIESGARLEAEDKRRELEAMHRTVRAEHDALAEREKIFAERIVPNAQREAQVTVAGFARDQIELRDARMRALDAGLELARVRVDLAKSLAELLYLTGESQL